MFIRSKLISWFKLVARSFLILAFAFLIYLFLGIILSNLYYPVRLYYTGELNQVTVSTTKKLHIPDKYGVKFEYYVATKETNFLIQVDRDLYEELQAGDKKMAFVSNQIKSGFITNGENITLIGCLFKDIEHEGYYFAFLFLCFLVPLYWSGIRMFLHEFTELHTKIKKENNCDLKSLSLLSMTKEYIPYLVIVAFIYLFGFYSVKAVFSVEKSGEVITGTVLSITTIGLAFSPAFILKLKLIINSAFSMSVFMKHIRLIVEIIIGLWGFSKLVHFIYITDLSKEEDYYELVKSFLEFLFDLQF